MRLGRRRQVDPDRPAALRHEADPRRPARAHRDDERAPRRRVRQPRAAHRRPARRARAGDHDRRRLPLVRDPATPFPARRRARPRPVHAEHGHRRVHRGRGGDPARRASRRGRADAPALLHRLDPRHPARRRRREQDGSRRLLAGALRGDRRRARQPRRTARRRRPARDPALCAARRQRRRGHGRDAVVRGADPARAPGDDRDRRRPRPRPPPLPRPVGDPADVRRPPRLPRVRGPGRGRGLAGGRRGRRAPVRPALARRGGRDGGRQARGGRSGALGHRAPRGRRRRRPRRPARRPGRSAHGCPRAGGPRRLDERAAARATGAPGDQAHHPYRPGDRGRAALRRRHDVARGAGKAPSAWS